jgi:aldose 1-epimerase
MITKKYTDNLALFRITNGSGAYVEVLNYGATLVSAVVPDKNNCLENVALRYPDVRDYLTDACYLGATVGRVANRISGAKFILNGREFCLDKNDGNNSNHGGCAGFNKKLFDYKTADNSVIFSAQSPDGEGGFPGNAQVQVAYSFDDNNTLHIQYRVVSDKDTIVNLTNHAYFNLCPSEKNIFRHELQVNADQCLEMNEHFLPTGKILPIADTAFDFAEYKNVGQMMNIKKERHIKGYNAYFIGQEKSHTDAALLATLRSPASGRSLRVYSTMPGVQFYTGDYLCDAHQPFAGLCLEASFYPDAPNHPHFPSCAMAAHQVWQHEILYEFANFGKKE